VRNGFVHGCDKSRFRIVHFSVQGRHIHFICEAANRRALSRGVQGFKIRVARGINRKLRRKGTVFADRYHERIIENPTQCRYAIAYVLNNQRHHGYEEQASYPRNRVDPCSSAPYFTGWTVEEVRPWARAPARTDEDDARPVALPRHWMLRSGWRRGGGAISPNTIPGLPAGAPALPQW
jgi:REP element-mobilizing transposase RayT